MAIICKGWSFNIEEEDRVLFANEYELEKKRSMGWVSESDVDKLSEVIVEGRKNYSICLVLNNPDLMDRVFEHVENKEDKKNMAVVCKKWSQMYLFHKSAPGFNVEYMKRLTSITKLGVKSSFPETMVKLKMKSLSPSKSSPSQRKAGRKVKAEGNRKVKPEEDLLLPIDETKKADVKSSQIRVPSDFTKRCLPSSLTVVISALSEEKKEAVRQIGFGGLLHLKLTSVPMIMFSQLLFAFRSEEYFEVSETEKFRLTEDDICDVFGLPNGGHDLELLVTGLASSSSPDGESLKSLWRERYNIISSKDPIPLSAVKTKLLSNGLTDEEFKQTFVLFAMSSFLAPASGAVVDLRLLSAVEDVSRIHQLNWLLLAIVYFHRYIKRGSKLSNELPLIQHWNDQKFGDRLKREEAAGGLGHSDRSEVVFPISRKHSNKSGEASSLPNNPVGNVRHIVVDLPSDICTDEEVHASFIDDVHELLLLNERDSELFCKRYMDKMNQIKLKMQARSEQSSLKDSSQVSPSAGCQETGTVDGVGTEQLVATPSFFTS
ncbi:hypothetical protein KSS87_022764 [Heliosperma pusillum]|nr:hypothetical protein KSS87_022764 [Heliosperma pusillum]